MGKLNFKALMLSELWKKGLRFCQEIGAICQAGLIHHGAVSSLASPLTSHSPESLKSSIA